VEPERFLKVVHRANHRLARPLAAPGWRYDARAYRFWWLDDIKSGEEAATWT